MSKCITAPSALWTRDAVLGVRRPIDVRQASALWTLEDQRIFPVRVRHVLSFDPVEDGIDERISCFHMRHHANLRAHEIGSGIVATGRGGGGASWT
jgi:hypothetical protein